MASRPKEFQRDWWSPLCCLQRSFGGAEDTEIKVSRGSCEEVKMATHFPLLHLKCVYRALVAELCVRPMDTMMLRRCACRVVCSSILVANLKSSADGTTLWP